MGRTPKGFSTAKARKRDARKKEKRSAQSAAATASSPLAAAATTASSRSHRRPHSSSAARGAASRATRSTCSTRSTDDNSAADAPPTTAAAAASATNHNGPARRSPRFDAASSASKTADEVEPMETDEVEPIETDDGVGHTPSCAGRKRPHQEVVADDLMGALLDLCSGDIDRMEIAVDGMINDGRFRPIMERWTERAAKEFASKVVPAATAATATAAADIGYDAQASEFGNVAIDEDGPSPRAKKRRRKLVDKAKAPDLNNRAYHWEGRPENSAQSLRSQQKGKLKKLLMTIGQSDEQRALTLHDFLNDKDVLRYSKAAGYWPSVDAEAALHMIQQMKKHLARLSDTGKPKPRSGGRRVSRDKLGAEEAIAAAVANSPDRVGQPSRKKIAGMMGLTGGSGQRKLKYAEEKRQQLKRGNTKVRWSSPKDPLRKKKIPNPLRKKVRNWLRKHSKVVASPNKSDTVLIRDPETGEPTRVGKLLRACSFRELHNDLYDEAIGLEDAWNTEVTDRNDPKFQLISDTMLREIAPEELRKMKEWHKGMCQCIPCSTAKLMQQTLLAFRRAHLKRLEKIVAKKDREDDEEGKQHYQERLDKYRSEVIEDNEMKHPDENAVAKSLTCGAKVDGIPSWKCVSRECSSCPRLTLPEEESGEYEDGAPEITFRIWETRYTCSKHDILPLGYTVCHACNEASYENDNYVMGKISNKKRPSRKTKPIENFLREDYKTAMDTYVWHRCHVIMLSNSVTGKARKAALLPGSIRWRWSGDRGSGAGIGWLPSLWRKNERLRQGGRGDGRTTLVGRASQILCRMSQF